MIRLIISVITAVFKEKPFEANFEGHFFPRADPREDPEAAISFQAAANIFYLLYDQNEPRNDATYS